MKELCGKLKTNCEKDCRDAQFDIIIKMTREILYAKSYIYHEALRVYKKTTDILKKRMFIGEKVYVENYLTDSEIKKKC